jgi:hypothetical protein
MELRIENDVMFLGLLLQNLFPPMIRIMQEIPSALKVEICITVQL